MITNTFEEITPVTGITSSSGFTCNLCGQWTSWGSYHCCYSPDYLSDVRVVSVLERIADALEKLVESKNA